MTMAVAVERTKAARRQHAAGVAQLAGWFGVSEGSAERLRRNYRPRTHSKRLKEARRRTRT